MSLSINDYTKYNLYNLFLMNKDTFNISNLRKAYQRQILIYHPDKFSDNITEDEKKEQTQIFHLINNAYTILSNETLREEYNSKRSLIETEDKNFLDLKQGFNKYKNTNKTETTSEQLKLIQLEFDKKMKLMNKELDKELDNEITDIEIKKNKLELEREDNTNILNFINSNNLELNSDVLGQENMLLLTTNLEKDTKFLNSEKVLPSDNFDQKLSDINTNRNTKLENNGTKMYDSLHSDSSNKKYASLDEAYSFIKN